jgi:hypothetical protein
MGIMDTRFNMGQSRRQLTRRISLSKVVNYKESVLIAKHRRMALSQTATTFQPHMPR